MLFGALLSAVAARPSLQGGGLPPRAAAASISIPCGDAFDEPPARLPAELRDERVANSVRGLDRRALIVGGYPELGRLLGAVDAPIHTLRLVDV